MKICNCINLDVSLHIMKTTLRLLILFFLTVPTVRSQTYNIVKSDSIVFRTKYWFEEISNDVYFYIPKKAHIKKGTWRIYSDSTFNKLLTEITYDDKKNEIGASRQYYLNGQLEFAKENINAIKCDLLLGNMTLYDSTGLVLWRSVLEHDTLTLTAFYKNGNYKQIEKSSCKIDDYYYIGDVCNPIKKVNEDKYPQIDYFYFARFCENGQLINEYNPNEYFQRIKEYDCEGNINREYILNKSMFCGEYIEYYPTGKIKSKGNMTTISTDGEYSFNKIGEWLYYDESGNIIKSENK